MPRQNSRKTANILQEVGRALYGDIWQSELARDLGCNDRTVRKWNAGDAPIPEYLRKEVAKICRRRGNRLIEMAEQLGATARRSPGPLRRARFRRIRASSRRRSNHRRPTLRARAFPLRVILPRPAPRSPERARGRPGRDSPDGRAISPGLRPGVLGPGVVAPTVRIVTVPKGAPLPPPSSNIKYVRER